MTETKLKTSADIPFSPAGFPFFYGWIILGATTIGMVASIPGQTIGVGVFRGKLETALGLSGTQLALAYMFGTVTSSFLLPFAGSLLDRVGSRRMIIVSSLGLGASLLVMANLNKLTTFTENTFQLVALTSVAYLLIRFFGQGCLTLTSRVTVGKWFNHHRGLATGVMSIFVAFTFNSSPHFLNKLVDGFDWHNAYLILAAVVGIGMTAIGWIFFRDNPEECGLVMDGKTIHIKPTRKPSRVPQTVRDFTRPEAVKTFSFWVFATAAAWQALMMTAIAFLIDFVGEDAGLTRTETYAVFPIIGFLSIIITILAALISDRTRLKWFLLAMVAAQLITAVGLRDFSGPAHKALFIAGYAFSGSVFSLLLTITWPRFFGRKHLGAISGLTTSLMVFASAVGPIIFTALRDHYGGFEEVVIICMIIPGLLLGPAMLVANPQEKFRNQVIENQAD